MGHGVVKANITGSFSGAFVRVSAERYRFRRSYQIPLPITPEYPVFRHSHNYSREIHDKPIPFKQLVCFQIGPREALNKSARADSERFCSQARYGKWRNTLCTRKGYAASVSQFSLATAALYFPFFVPKPGGERSAVRPPTIPSEFP